MTYVRHQGWGAGVRPAFLHRGPRGLYRGATSGGFHLGLWSSIDSNILILRPSKQNPEIASMFAVTFALLSPRRNGIENAYSDEPKSKFRTDCAN